jgi:hypothetical protein
MTPTDTLNSASAMLAKRVAIDMRAMIAAQPGGA